MNIGFFLPSYEGKLSGIGRYAKGILEETDNKRICKYCFGQNFLNTANMIEMHSLYERNSMSDQAVREKYLLCKLANIDVVYSFFAPILFENNSRIKSILTIHDLAPLVNMEWHGYNQSMYDLFDIQIRKSAHIANKIVAVSEYTRKTIVDYYGISEDKIEIATPAIASDLVDSKVTNKDIQEVRKKFAIEREYILSICTFEPRKNLVSLIESYGIYREKNKGSDIQLVLVGKLGWNFNNILDKVNQSKYKADIILTDYVSDYELGVLYMAALVFAYVSFFEGFGMPVLEALHYGKAVLTSDTTSMPEVGGDAVCYCNPYELESVYSSLEHLLEDAEYRKMLQKKAKAQAEKFSYKKSAKKVEEILLELVRE